MEVSISMFGFKKKNAQKEKEDALRDEIKTYQWGKMSFEDAKKEYERVQKEIKKEMEKRKNKTVPVAPPK